MNNLKSILKTNPTDWLLEKNNPSIRYFTLREILEKPKEDLELQEARLEIMKAGLVPVILAKQKKKGIGKSLKTFIQPNTRELFGRFLFLQSLGQILQM